MILFFDTETNGLPKKRSAPLHDTSNWPRLVQLAWIQYDANGSVVTKSSSIIKPEGFIIPQDAADIHGISHERAMREGAPLRQVLFEFREAVGRSKLLVAHNFEFDYPVLYAEFSRSGIPHEMQRKQRFCTMMSTKNLLRIPHPKIRNDYKWPKLEELHRYLFNSGFANAHNAATDVEITAKCFWELYKRKLIQSPELNKIISYTSIHKNCNENKISFFNRLKEFFNF